MHVDVLIVGQGISGSLLSWFLNKEGKSFLVIDEGKEETASKISAGIINPVTGRRHVTTWMIEDIMDFAKTTYSEIGIFLGENIFKEKRIIDFFPSAQMRDSFVERMIVDDTYLHTFPDHNYFKSTFEFSFGCGEIKPVYSVSIQPFLKGWRHFLSGNYFLLEEGFKVDALKITAGGVTYNDISAEKIIFCDGIASLQNPWFQLLPFSANKGEALIIKCEGLGEDFIYKKGMMLAALPQKHMYWFGSNYQWEFKSPAPSEEFFIKSNSLLKSWLKLPYEVVAHNAAVRPATLERRPFVGFHPAHPQIGILNGMGTKGSSLAPFFANQLVQHLIYNFPIADEANVHRYSRILLKQ